MKLIRKKIHSTYKSMKGRCHTESAGGYSFYGALGITVCDEWKNSFDLFYQWAINSGFKIGLSIDRINTKGNYNPENCRWVNQYIQSINQKKRSTNKSGYTGVSFYKRDSIYTVQISVKGKQIWIGRFATAIEGAEARDFFIMANQTEHPINLTYQELYYEKANQP